MPIPYETLTHGVKSVFFVIIILKDNRIKIDPDFSEKRWG